MRLRSMMSVYDQRGKFDVDLLENRIVDNCDNDMKVR